MGNRKGENSGALALKKQDNSLSFITEVIKPRKLETKVIKYIDENTDNIIKASMAHIALPFFTKRKKGRNVHLEYDIGFMGLTMNSHINTDPNKNISQPGETEEMVYEFLIDKMNVLVNAHKAINGDDIDYSSFLEHNRIEFDYTEFAEAAGLKLTPSINTRIDKALANMKYTTYTFNKKNKAKSDKRILEFEEDVFSLINYKKLTVGKKTYYSVMLKNPVLVDAYEKKLFLNYTSSDSKLMGGNNKITDKVYKIISMPRFNKDIDEISVMQLACSVPYELTSKSVSKGKTYLKCKKNEVVRKLVVNFNELVNLGYLKWYEVENDEVFKYEFLDKKLPLVTSPTLKKHLEYKSEENKIEAKSLKKKAKVIEETEQPIIVDSSDCNLDKAISKCKRNIFASKAWNKRVENKISKIVAEDGEEYAIKILGAIYHNLKGPVSKTLVQYINGIIKNTPKGEHPTLKKDKTTPIEKKSQEKKSITPEIVVGERSPKSIKDIVKTPKYKKSKSDFIVADIVDDNVKVNVKSEMLDETTTATYKIMYNGAISIIEDTKKNPEKDILLKTVKKMKTVSALSNFLDNL